GMVCGFAGFQKNVTLVFFKGSLLKDKRKLLNHNTGSINTRGFKFKEAKEINEDILLEYLFEAIDLNKKGKKVVVPKDRTVEVAKDIKKEFKLAGVLKYFENMAYSHRKEYMNWIESAKREETRISRIEKAVVMIGKKETMMTKYKK
nr:YdeI/OmpD-associated family protein [Bacteroidota bacterium]